MSKQGKEDKSCDTCEYYDEFEGDCQKQLADAFECRSCDTSECAKYKLDPFYAALGAEK